MFLNLISVSIMNHFSSVLNKIGIMTVRKKLVLIRLILHKKKIRKLGYDYLYLLILIKLIRFCDRFYV